VRPTVLQRILAGLFAFAGVYLIFGAFATAPRGAGYVSHPVAFTLIVIIGYGAFFGNYWMLRNTDAGESAAGLLKTLLGAISFPSLFVGIFNVVRLKDPAIPSRFLVVDGCIFGVLFLAFHLYTKRSSNRELA
jgi:hypothetical protein